MELFTILEDYTYTIGIYTHLESAKKRLILIYEKDIQNYRECDYMIKVYHLVGGEFIYSNKYYRYRFDTFTFNTTDI